MAKKLTVLILAAFLAGTAADRAAAGGLKKTKPLADGFVLAGVDGKLRSADGNEPDKWFFEFDSDASDGKGLIKAGAAIELLPSSALEKILDVKSSAALQKQKQNTSHEPRATSHEYRLWGRVTKYRSGNFIFGIYFLPLGKVKQPKPSSQQQEDKVTINEPNDAFAIPQEIIDKLKARPTVSAGQLRKGLALKQDFILADRTGFIRDSGNKVSFVLDALGRNVPQVKFNLLPCEALERAQQKQSAEPEPIRFKAAGIVTGYKGENYLLLQRAERTYSHGNFGR